MFVLREEAHDPWRIPTGMAKFEAVTSFRRKHAEKGGKAVRIGLKVGRQLEKNRAGLVDQATTDDLSINSRLLTEFAESRFQWVMNFDAFHVKTKSLPVCSFQLLTASGVGVR